MFCPYCGEEDGVVQTGDRQTLGNKVYEACKCPCSEFPFFVYVGPAPSIKSATVGPQGPRTSESFTGRPVTDVGDEFRNRIQGKE